MLRKTLVADAVDVDHDQGTFTAIVSAWSADREKDVIVPSAFDKTIAAWRSSGKRLPLLLEHSTTVVGAIDPESMRPTADGLVVGGEVDRTTEEGQRVWRSIKSGVLGFSIGFLSESRPRPGGGRELTEIDLLEISATSKPMHPATRALSWKAATTDAEIPSEADQRRRAARLMLTPEQERDVDQWVSVITEAISGTKSTPAATKSGPIRIASFEC